MSSLATALRVEARKALAARVVLGTAVVTVLGILAIVGGFAAAVLSGNTEAIAKLGPEAAAPGWDGLLSAATQVEGAALLLAVGVLQSWITGREFADGTITGLYGLAVGRGVLALAKTLVAAAAGLAIALVLAAGVVLLGLVLGFGALDADQLATLARLLGLGALTTLLGPVAALAATLGRGLLAGIGATVALVASAQVAVLAGSGPWYPVATPALWAIEPGAVPPAAFAPLALLTLAATALLAVLWRRLQLDR